MREVYVVGRQCYAVDNEVRNQDWVFCWLVNEMEMVRYGMARELARPQDGSRRLLDAEALLSYEADGKMIWRESSEISIKISRLLFRLSFELPLLVRRYRLHHRRRPLVSIGNSPGYDLSHAHSARVASPIEFAIPRRNCGEGRIQRARCRAEGRAYISRTVRALGDDEPARCPG
jgi:hypothetical protein